MINSKLSVKQFSFGKFEKLSYFEEKGRRLIFSFHKSELLKNDKAKLVSELIFLLFSNKRVAFFRTPIVL